MTPTSKPTILLVPGSYATAEMYDKLVSLITKAGYEYKLVPILSANDGTRLPAPTMEDDAARIRSDVLEVLDRDRDVVIVLSSYAGFPGSEALKGFGKPDRGEGAAAVVGILYAAALLPTEGECNRDLMTDKVPDYIKIGTPGGYMPFPSELGPFVFNDLTDPAEVERYTSLMVSQSSDSFSGKLSYAAWRHIPGIYVNTGKDMIVPPETQKFLLDRVAKEGGKVESVFWEDSGHCPMISQPERFFEQLIKVTEL